MEAAHAFSSAAHLEVPPVFPSSALNLKEGEESHENKSLAFGPTGETCPVTPGHTSRSHQVTPMSPDYTEVHIPFTVQS